MKGTLAVHDRLNPRIGVITRSDEMPTANLLRRSMGRPADMGAAYQQELSVLLTHRAAFPALAPVTHVALAEDTRSQSDFTAPRTQLNRPTVRVVCGPRKWCARRPIACPRVGTEPIWELQTSWSVESQWTL